MAKKLNVEQDNMVFGLDIGTRSVVGIIGYKTNNSFHIVAMSVKEHESRAMIDGQIHDIEEVGRIVGLVKADLEKQTGTKLTKACVAAAGRVLKTVNVKAEIEFDEETRITKEHIYSLDMLAVEEAYEIIASKNASKYYCVGNSPITYYLNEYEFVNIENHKGTKIGVELIATFLPDEVVDGLNQALYLAGLEIIGLTLEPIAAINVAIPKQYRLLNIALIDVGAGTSDICITKEGNVVAFGMIPSAGDEITEAIVEKYLVDFNTAEYIKREAANGANKIEYEDIMGLPMTTTSKEVVATCDKVVRKIAKEASKKIVELNCYKPVSAVFVVGGGGKIPGYTDYVAQELKIAKERVALRGKEVLKNVEFDVKDFEKDSLYVTPVGICMNYYSSQSKFIYVRVNDVRVKLYDTGKLTVSDALMQVSYPNEDLFAKSGKELRFSVNKKTRLIRGDRGESALITINDKPANINSVISDSDNIKVTPSTVGADAKATLADLEEFKESLTFEVNGKKLVCPRFAYVNGNLENEYYEIKNDDDIKMENFYTVKQLLVFMDVDANQNFEIMVNNVAADMDTLVYENFTITFKYLNEK
ncbi:MAG: rod shape-determining protein [Lachnospiraceae bacterium]|nr:rod shape-determining protein [Lachnospiraceae bacterium]